MTGAAKDVTISVRVTPAVADALAVAYGKTTTGAGCVLDAAARALAALPAQSGLFDPLKSVLAAHEALRAGVLRRIRDERLFSRAETNLILDATNGLALAEHLAGHCLVMEVSDSIALNRSDVHHGVDDGPALVAKLAALHPFERWCLELWSVDWWATRGQPHEQERAARVFRQVCADGSPTVTFITVD